MDDVERVAVLDCVDDRSDGLSRFLLAVGLLLQDRIKQLKNEQKNQLLTTRYS